MPSEGLEKMCVGFFSRWYEAESEPAALISVTARALAARGPEVHVLTGFHNCPTGTTASVHETQFSVDRTTTQIEALLTEVSQAQRSSIPRRARVESHG